MDDAAPDSGRVYAVRDYSKTQLALVEHRFHAAVVGSIRSFLLFAKAGLSPSVRLHTRVRTSTYGCTNTPPQFRNRATR